MILLRPGRVKQMVFGKQSLQSYEPNPTEFDWKIFTGITPLGLLEKIQSLMTDLQCEPENFKDRTIFISMYNDIAWGEN